MHILRIYLELQYIDKKYSSPEEEHKKNYFTKEYNWYGLNKSHIPHYKPRVPTQCNAYDCGLYLLENAETFLEMPDFIIENMNQVNAKLFKRWIVEEKREVIKRLVVALIKDGEKDNPAKVVADNYLKWRSGIRGVLTHL
jgi:hypothetical protein